jgi:hypothetical protein
LDCVGVNGHIDLLMSPDGASGSRLYPGGHLAPKKAGHLYITGQYREIARMAIWVSYYSLYLYIIYVVNTGNF